MLQQEIKVSQNKNETTGKIPSRLISKQFLIILKNDFYGEQCS